MKNTLIIYNRELFLSFKKRKVFLFLLIYLTIVSLLFILALNYIIIGIKNSTEINYYILQFFSKIGLSIVIIFSSFTPMLFFSTSINSDKQNKTIENILNTNITKKDIVLGKFFKGIISCFALFFASLPILYLTVIFGGVSFFKLFKIVVLLIFFMFFISSVHLFISSMFYEINTSIFVSIFVSIFATIIMIFLIEFLKENFKFFMSLIFFIISTIVFIRLTIESKLFKY